VYISCDYDNKLNPIQIYDKKTTWDNPVLKLENTDVIAIDNLPSLLPVDSSIYFSTQLSVLLSNYHNDIDKHWVRNKNIFHLKIDS
jgi:saccharopine dehydrogenase (NAD+, L-lysine-forming)